MGRTRQGQQVSAIPVSWRRDEPEVSYKLRLGDQDVPISRKWIPIGELKLDPRNQRIQYAITKAGGADLAEDTKMEEILWEQDRKYLDDLYNSVFQHGGVIHPLAVTHDNVVLEGNCRLVILRKLAQKYPGDGRFSVAPCEIFLEGLTEEQRILIVGEWHLFGKHEWRPYEKAEYLFKASRIFHKTLDDLATHVKMSRKEIEHNITAYGWMRDYLALHPEPVSLEKFSYMLEFLKKKSLVERFEREPSFKDWFFELIAQGKLTRGEQVRGLAKYVVGNVELEKMLAEEGWDVLEQRIKSEEPALESNLYRALDRATVRLNKANTEELDELRKGSPAKARKLRELYKALSRVSDFAGLKLES